jgi:siroheme synthase (precorrin-2 oxidase/ferrochelatase)
VNVTTPIAHVPARRWRHAWQSARWPAIGALFAAAVVLGWIGFDRSMAALGQSGTFSDKLYLSLQLFVLQSGAVLPPVPWELDVARFLAPAVTAYATVSAVAAVLGEQVSGMRARLSSGHVVVCGLGRLGALLAKALRAAGYAVVAIESDPRNAEIGECREEGIIVLIGDATDRTLLRTTGVERARFLFAATGDDGANAEIAIEARGLVEGRTGSPLTCFIHIADARLGGVLKQLGVAQRGGDSFRLEYFNAAQRGAPALLREHPAFDNQGNTPFGPPHLLVVGLGEMGSSLVVQAARRWRSILATSGRRFRVTVVDDKADDHVAALVEHFPRLKDACELSARRIDLDSAGFERADFLFGPDGVCAVTSVYVCIGDDAVGLSAALHLRRRLGGREVPIVVRTTRKSGVAALLAGDHGSDRHDGIEVFGLLDLVCRPDVLLKGQNEVLAQAVHDDYVRHQRKDGANREANPSMVDWEELPETLKESNRRQAADIGRKLQAVGCDMEPLTDWDAPPLAFSHDEVELLARMEHDSWQKEREAEGWTYGPEKDVVKKKSPYLGPYDGLPEEIKDYDRNTVRAIPTFLAEGGFAVVRLGRVGRDGD